MYDSNDSISFLLQKHVLGCVGKIFYWAKFKKQKNQQQQFFFFNFGCDDLKWNCSKCIFFLNLKKLPMNNNYMMYVCSKILDFFKIYILSNSVSNQLKKKIEKHCCWRVFLNFAPKNTSPTRPHTCIQINEWGINLQKSIKIFERAIFII
jgi:hypothetical protein